MSLEYTINLKQVDNGFTVKSMNHETYKSRETIHRELDDAIAEVSKAVLGMRDCFKLLATGNERLVSGGHAEAF